MKSTKRSRLLISLLQVRLMLLSVAYLLTLALTLGATLFWPLAQRVEDPQLSPAERATAAAELLALHGRFWPAFAIVAATFIAHQLLVSHRIAGPLYRIRQVLKAMARGELPSEVRLRKRDLLSEEADELNALICAWRARVGEARGSLERAQSIAAQWEPAERAEQRELKSELAGALERLELELGRLDSQGARHAQPGASEQPPPALPRSMPHAQADAANAPTHSPVSCESESSDANARNSSRGFTLLELLVIVAILGVVAGMAVPGYRSAVTTARVAVAIREVNLLMNEIDLYELRNGELPASLADIDRANMSDPWGNPYQYLNFVNVNLPGGGNGGFGGAGEAQGGGRGGGNPGGGGGGGGNSGSGSEPGGSEPGGSEPGGSNSSGGSSNGGSSSGGGEPGGGNSGGGNSGGGSNSNAGGGGGNNAGGADKPRKDRFLVPINSTYDLYSMGADGRSVAPLTASMSRDDIVRASDGDFVGLAEDY